MDKKILIRNFGPVSNCELEINDFILFIGEQASGKSTICKCIYFFRAMRDDIFTYLVESINNRSFDKFPRVLYTRIRQRFLDFFGSSRHLDNTFLKFNYSSTNYIEITLSPKERNITTDYSSDMLKSLINLEERAKRFCNDLYQYNDNLSSTQVQLIEKRAFYQELKLELNRIFNDDRELVYIPAGRSLLSLLSDQLSTISLANLDYITSQFLRIIQEEKISFKDGIDELISRKKHTTIEPINRKMVELAKVTLRNVLKGEYRYDINGEKIILDSQSSKFVKINYASSGQHESIWILYMIFSWILNQKKMFVVIEEPEAHLFPVAQRDLVNLIALFFNQNNNQVLITTHSPYILTSINNLLYAYKVGQEKENAVNRVIDKEYWLNTKRVSAYYLESNKQPQSMIDNEVNLVKAEKIDDISSIINDEYTKLYDLED